MDDDGEEDDPLEHYADFESRFCETDNIERMDREKLLSKMTNIGKNLCHLYYIKGMKQDEIAAELHTKQYRISRLLKELDEAIGKESLDDGERTETDIQVKVKNSMSVSIIISNCLAREKITSSPKKRIGMPRRSRKNYLKTASVLLQLILTQKRYTVI